MDDSLRREVLEQLPLLADFPEDELQEILSQSIIRQEPAGSMLVSEGENCQGMALVLSGSIRIYKLSPEGRELTLYRVEDGEISVLSVTCLLAGMPHPAFAQVEQPTRLLMIPRDHFQDLFNRNPRLQRLIFSRMVDRMVDLMVVIGEVAFQRMDQRVAAWLLRQRGDVVTVTHERIASDLGTVREVVSRVLKEMESLGVVALSRGRIEIRSEKRLQDLAQ